MSYRQLDIKHSYVSYGDENIAKAFLIPMLRQTKLYRRSVGFFSSSVFSTIIGGIVSLSRNGGKIQLIASPNLSADDIQAINLGYQKREDIIAGAFERDFADALAELEDAHLQLLAALIANDTMDIKIAVTQGTGIYHDKLGILEDFDGNTVVFYGSANSTASGYKNNYEKIRVVKSWVQADAESITDEIDEFDALWNNTNVPDQHRYFRKACHFSSMGAAVSGDDLVSAIIQRPCNQRCQHTVLGNAFRRSQHSLVIDHLERMILKGHQLTDADVLHSFQLALCTALIRFKDIIVAGQADVSASFRHSATPPLSDSGRPRQPCLRDRA